MAQVGQNGQNADDTASAKTDDHHRPWFKRPVAWIGTLATAVVTGVAITLASSYAGNTVSRDNHALAPTEPPAAGGQAAHLEVDEVSLTAAGVSPSNKLTPFKIDIRLLNTGSQVAAINHVRLIVQQFASLPMCANQGGFGSTGAYSANMPTAPLPGQVVDVPISQLVPAGGADRFDVLLQARLLQGPIGLTLNLYRVHAYLTYNVGTKSVDLGEILVDLPFAPDSGMYFWTHDIAANPKVLTGVLAPSQIPPYKRCAIKNSNELHSILALPAMRTAGLAAILPQLAY